MSVGGGRERIMTPKTRHRREETEEGIEWEMAGMPACFCLEQTLLVGVCSLSSGPAEILIIRRQTRPGRAGDRRLAIRLPRDGIDHLGLHRHVSLIRRRQHSFISRSLLTVQLKQEASRAEPKSLRPLQAEEEYVFVSLASLLPSLLILLFFALQLQSVVRLLCFPPNCLTDILQAMGLLPAYLALIVRRLAANVSSQRLPRCAYLSDLFLVSFD